MQSTVHKLSISENRPCRSHRGPTDNNERKCACERDTYFYHFVDNSDVLIHYYSSAVFNCIVKHWYAGVGVFGHDVTLSE